MTTCNFQVKQDPLACNDKVTVAMEALQFDGSKEKSGVLSRMIRSVLGSDNGGRRRRR